MNLFTCLNFENTDIKSSMCPWVKIVAKIPVLCVPLKCKQTMTENKTAKTELLRQLPSICTPRRRLSPSRTKKCFNPLTKSFKLAAFQSGFYRGLSMSHCIIYLNVSLEERHVCCMLKTSPSTGQSSCKTEMRAAELQRNVSDCVSGQVETPR